MDPKTHKYLFALFLVLFTPLSVAWLSRFGTPTRGRDFAIMICSIMLSLLLWPRVRRFALSLIKPSTAKEPVSLQIKEALRFLLTSFLFTWILASIADSVFSPPALPLDRNRFSSLRKSKWQGLNVGMCLSGGGYRAALLHAGVLQCLEDHGVKVTCLSTVSGGSIIGSFYALGGRPHDFKEAVRSGRFNLKRELMHAQNIVRLPFPAELPWLKVKLFPFYEFSRNDVQRELLDRSLLRESSWQKIDANTGPQLLVCATDLRNGLLVGFTSEGILFRGPTQARFVPNAELSTNISEAVAVSGAFPGAFAPKTLALTLSTPIGEMVKRFQTWGKPDLYGTNKIDVVLVDGGAIDNLGLELLLTAHYQAAQENMREHWRQDVLLVSNGGMLIQRSDEIDGLEVLFRSIEVGRSFSAIMAEQGHGLWEKDYGGPPIQWLSPWLLKKPAESVLRLRPINETDPTLLQDLFGTGVTDEIHRELVAINPDNTHAAELLKELETYSSAHPNPLTESSTERLKLFKMRLDLHTEIASDIQRCIRIFMETKTLADHPPPNDVDAIFRLGQYLVLLKWTAIEEALDQQARRKSTNDRNKPSLSPRP